MTSFSPAKVGHVPAVGERHRPAHALLDPFLRQLHAHLPRRPRQAPLEHLGRRAAFRVILAERYCGLDARGGKDKVGLTHHGGQGAVHDQRAQELVHAVQFNPLAGAESEHPHRKDKGAVVVSAPGRSHIRLSRDPMLGASAEEICG